MNSWVLNITNSHYTNFIRKEPLVNKYLSYNITVETPQEDRKIVRIDLEVYPLSATLQAVKEFLGLDLTIDESGAPEKLELVLNLGGTLTHLEGWDMTVYDKSLYYCKDGRDTLRSNLKAMLNLLDDVDQKMMYLYTEDYFAEKNITLGSYGFTPSAKSLIEVVRSYPYRQGRELLKIIETFLTAQTLLRQF